MPRTPILIRHPLFPAFLAAATTQGIEANRRRLEEFNSPFRPGFVYHVQSVECNVLTLLHPSVLSDYECYVVTDSERVCLGVGEPLYMNSDHVVFAVYAYESGSESRRRDKEGGLLVVPSRHVWLDPGLYLPHHLRTPTWFFLFHWSRILSTHHQDVRLAFERPVALPHVVAISYPSPKILSTVRRREDEYGW